MSRTGKQLVSVPDKVQVGIVGDLFTAQGPLGKEVVKINPLAKVKIDSNKIQVERIDDTKQARCVHGLVRALINNAVTGVSQGFTRELEINGVGYRAEAKGKALSLTLGFSHPVEHPIPEGIKIAVDKQTKIIITGSNREKVGQVASDIRSYRPPEPYKGKGVKYVEERIIRKVGKAAGGK